ncbi:MAG: C4-dicarboxylate TRAP transporter substrate-binding protein [Marinobacter sp.]
MKPITAIKSIVLTSILGCFGVGQAIADTTFRYAEASPNRGTRAEALQYFADEVKRESGGDMKLDIHWGGALLKYNAIMDGVGAGTADLGSVLAAYQPQELRALSIGDFPTANSDPWVGLRAMYELMTENEQLQAALAEQDLVYLGNFTTTSVQFECTKGNEIRTVADLKGKRIRATGIYTKVLSDLGANLVNMTYADVYQALDSGLLDCSSSYFYAMRSFKTAEVVDTVTRVDWGQVLGFAIVINRYLWDDLNDEQQQVFRKAGADMIDFQAENLVKETEEIVEALPTGALGNAISVITMGADERQKLLAGTDKYIQEWVEEMDKAGFDGQQIWDQYSTLVDKYEAERDERGYPWDR